MSIKIILADDHVVMRQGLRTLLEKKPNIEVVGEADEGRAVVKLAGELEPDVVIMDVAMPDLNGIDATRQILSECPKTKIIALSMHSEKQYISGMLMAGASGYLLKNSTIEELVKAIETAVAGRIYLSSSLMDMVVEDYAKRLSQVNESVFSKLTTREREILQLIAEGKTAKEIANVLNVSISTINTHRQQIMRKLNIKNAVELTRFALREGITHL